MSRYLSVAEIIEINAEVVRKFGGIHGLRDSGANHPFLDGNKRTAITATGVFLLMNGYRLRFDDLEAYNWLIGLYESCKVNKATIEPWLRRHAEKL